MQVSIEASEGFNRQLKVTIPAEDYKKMRQKEIVMISKNRRFPGFRSGHVPTNVIEREYGAEIAERTINDLINGSIINAISQSKIENVSYESLPVVSNITDNGPAQDLTYTLEIEVNPEVNVDKDLSTIEIEKVKGVVSDADIDKMLLNLRKQAGKWKEGTDATCDQDDMVNISFEGSIDGVAFEGGKSDNTNVIIGAGRFIPGFEDQLKGHKAGDSFDINVTFPENYHNKDLAGKAAVFKAVVNKVSTLELPELNEEFFKIYSPDTPDLESFTKEVRKNMEREIEITTMTQNISTAFDKLYDEFSAGFDLPQRLLKKNEDDIKERYTKSGRPAPADDKIKEAATRNLKFQYIVGAFIKKHNITLDEKRVDAYIDTIASAYDSSEEYKKAVKNNREQFSKFADRAFEGQIADFIFSNAKTTEVEKSFTELTPNMF